jgi:uncharacterized integral membrane protein
MGLELNVWGSNVGLEGRRRTLQWEGSISGILLIPLLLGVLYLINSTVVKVDLLFVAADLLLAGLLVADVFAVVGAARKLGLFGMRTDD